MKKYNYTFILFLCYNFLSAQMPTHYTLSSPAEGVLRISIVFDANGAGPVELDNASISLFINDSFRDPAPTYLDIQGGSWGTTSIIDNATLSGACGAGNAGDYALLIISTSGIAILGDVTAGLPEDLVDISFATYDGTPVLGYDPSNGDPLSACVNGLGIDNTADIDVDGTGGPLTGIGYGDIIFLNGSQALPIVLTNFHAKPQENRHSEIEWSSEIEINSSHYELERSKDARTWEFLHNEKAQGYASNLTSYRFMDYNAIDFANEDDKLYYRLKMTDLDGSFEYSDIEVVSFERSGPIVNVFPNPVSQYIRIETNTLNKDGNIIVRDELGKVVRNFAFSGQKSIDVTSFVPGIYFIYVITKSNMSTHKIIITH